MNTNAVTDERNSAFRPARLTLGISQSKVAAMIGVATHTYLQWELGNSLPKPEYAEKISEVLRIPLDQIKVLNRHRPFHKKPNIKLDEKRAALVEKYASYRERRLELGLSQGELAQKAGLKKMTISAMETGRCEPLWKTRQMIRTALGWPEEHHFSVEERNKLLLEMENIIRWVLFHHKEYFREANVELEDAYQDLTLRAIIVIDRYQPVDDVPIRQYVMKQLMYEAKSIRTRALTKGFTGNGSRWLPYDAVVSLEDANSFGDKMALELVA